MTREIKFKAARYDGIYKIVEWNFEGRQDILLIDKNGNQLRESLKNLDILQYIGLKDKNGKKIYEGDILQKFYSDGEIEGSYIIRCQLVKSCSCCQTPVHGWNIENPEKEIVIGNIYENPELINKREN